MNECRKLNHTCRAIVIDFSFKTTFVFWCKLLKVQQSKMNVKSKHGEDQPIGLQIHYISRFSQKQFIQCREASIDIHSKKEKKKANLFFRAKLGGLPSSGFVSSMPRDTLISLFRCLTGIGDETRRTVALREKDWTPGSITTHCGPQKM